MSRRRRRRSMKLEFHDNPNYVTEFENMSCASYVIDTGPRMHAIRNERSSCID